MKSKFLGLFIICLTLATQVIGQKQSNSYSMSIFSENFEYLLGFKVQQVDSVRIDEFVIYNISENKQKELIKWDNKADSLFNNHEILIEEPMPDIDLKLNAKLIRNFHITTFEADKYSDSLFTEESFNWNLKEKTVEFTTLGIEISFE